LIRPDDDVKPAQLLLFSLVKGSSSSSGTRPCDVVIKEEKEEKKVE
jgi:hypothetical protein